MANYKIKGEYLFLSTITEKDTDPPKKKKNDERITV